MDGCDHSGTTVDWHVFIFIALHSKYSISKGKTNDNCDYHVAIVGHNEHHGGDMEERVDEDVEKAKDMLAN